MPKPKKIEYRIKQGNKIVGRFSNKDIRDTAFCGLNQAYSSSKFSIEDKELGMGFDMIMRMQINSLKNQRTGDVDKLYEIAENLNNCKEASANWSTTSLLNLINKMEDRK